MDRALIAAEDIAAVLRAVEAATLAVAALAEREAERRQVQRHVPVGLAILFGLLGLRVTVRSG